MKASTLIGAVLIVLGLLFLGPALGLFTLAIIWPGILLLLGVGFFAGFAASPKAYGLLMPGAILAISSIPFFMCTLSGDWVQMARLWPIFPLSVSVGFFLMYFVGSREKGLLIPAFILLGVGTIAWVLFNYIGYIFPILFIAGGLIMIFVGLGANKKKMKTDVVEITPDSDIPASEVE